MDELEIMDTRSPPLPLPSLPALPPKVAKAVSDVMGGIEKLEKGEANKFANYKYAGIESFLEMVRPLCANAGLIILMDEDSYEFRDAADKNGKMQTWLVLTFTFGLAHSSGETWAHRLRRTGMVQASMGSQAFGAAQSYALKSFLRSIELIATGDTEDADSHEQRQLPATNGKARAKAKAPQSMALSAEESASETASLLAKIEALKTVEEVDDFAKSNAALYARLIPEHQQTVRDACNIRRQDVKDAEQ